MRPQVLRPSRQRLVPPVLLLHGMLGAPASWQHFVRRLEYPGPALALTLPGHGRPARGVQRGFVGNLRELATELRQPSYVIGYSMGGRIALGLAAHFPERVLGVVAIGAHPGLASEARGEKLLWEAAQIETLDRCGLEGFVNHWEALPLFASQASLALEVTAEQRQLRLSHEAPGIRSALAELGSGSMPDLASRLESARLPVHFVAGSLDPAYVARGKQAANQIPSARASVIEGAGHNVLLEAPGPLAKICDQSLRQFMTLGDPSHDLASV